VLWSPTGFATATFLPAVTGPTGIFLRGTASYLNSGSTISVTSDPVYYISDNDLGDAMSGTSGNNIIFGNGGDDLIAAGIGALHVAAWHYWERDPENDAYLRRLIEACHRHAILVYAWFELPHVSEKFWDLHPEWREKTGVLQDAHWSGGGFGYFPTMSQGVQRDLAILP
jgi:Ca2+-binding RTX toxin-like protein